MDDIKKKHIKVTTALGVCFVLGLSLLVVSQCNSSEQDAAAKTGPLENLKPGADLRKAKLEGADLKGRNLARVNLKGADLNGANLSKANLYKANLIEADLSGANLSGVNLYQADLRGANLTNANLQQADLNGAELYRADLTGATCHSQIVLSEGFSCIDGVVKEVSP